MLTFNDYMSRTMTGDEWRTTIAAANLLSKVLSKRIKAKKKGQDPKNAYTFSEKESKLWQAYVELMTRKRLEYDEYVKKSTPQVEES